MSIETLLTDLISAVTANTAALGGKAPAATTTKPAATTTKPAATTTKPKADAYVATHTKAEAQALANRVKEEKGVPQIRAIIKALGYEKLADIAKAEDLDKLAAKCLEELGEGEEAGAEEGGEGDI